MRIGIDASRAFVDQPTGTERYAFEIISEMLKLPEAQEHEWMVYTRGVIPSEVKGSFDSSLRDSLKMTIQPISLPYLWTQVGLAARTWVDRLDVLWVPAHTLPLMRRAGLHTVVTIHGIEYEWLPAYENRLQRWYLPLSTKYAVATADKLIAVSEFTKKQLIERLGADEKKITVVSEGVTGQRIESKDQGIVLNKFGLKKGKYLLFVGTVQPRKNLERLIEAFSKLHAGSLKLVIAGKLGWQYEGVLAAPEKFGVADRVDMLGFISDIDRQGLLANCLAYVQPSITEGYGLPVLEALSAGVPVASSRGGALGEVATASNAAEVFDPLEVDDMTRALDRLVAGDKTYLKGLGDKGQRWAGQFTWKKAAQETLKILTTTR